MNNTAKINEDEIASHADYAAIDFEPMITHEQAQRFGSEILKDECVGIRIAAVILSKGKDELLSGLGKDNETLMKTIECLQEQKEFLEALIENNRQASTRLLCVAATVMPEDEE